MNIHTQIGIIVRNYWQIIAGLLCLLLIPLCLYVVAPRLVAIPANFSFSTNVNSFDNFYDVAKGAYSGEQQSATKFSYETITSTNGINTIKNTFSVSSLAGVPIFSVDRTYGIERITGMHVAGSVDRDRSGYLFTPRMKGPLAQVPDKSAFDYWHVNYDVSAHMEYRDSETLYGVDVYHYVANFSADQTKELAGTLSGVGKDKGIKLNINLQLWAEPYTGRIVQYADNTDAYYYNLADGKYLYPWNKFHNNTNPISAASQAKSISSNKLIILGISFGLPILLLLLSLALILFFILKHNSKSRIVSNSLLHNDFLLPILVGILLFATTLGLSYGFYVNGKQQTIANLHSEAVRTNESIYASLTSLADITRGGIGLMNTSKSIDRSQWKDYESALDLPTNYPGIVGTGFNKAVTAKEKDAFVSTVKAEGFPSFSIRPEGDRSSYTVITYIEPFNEQNQRAVGYDIESDSIRREAVLFARDSGTTAMTAKIVLVQNNQSEEPGFLILQPVYKPAKEYTTPTERQAAIYGYVFAAIRMNNFMASIFSHSPTQLGVEIFDGGNDVQLTPDRLMYKSDTVSDGVLTDIQNITFANHQWTIRYTLPKTLATQFSNNGSALAVLIVGLIMSILLSVTLYTLTTRRKRAVEYADVVTKDLEYASRRLHLATKAAKIGVWEWDVVKNILVWDDQMYELYGIKKEDFGGAYEAWQKGLHPDDKKSGDDAIQAALKGEKDFSPQFRVIWPNGEIRYVQAYAVVERDSSGKPLKMVGVNWDITKESVVDRQKTEFVSLASHQLKTPIGSIQWDLEMLLAGDYGPVSDKQRDILNEAYTMGKRMNDLVNALLNISRIETGVFIIEPKQTDFIKLCEEVIKEMEPRLAKKGHELIKDFDKNLNQIPADDKLLRIVYQNFISNAIKYTPDKGEIKVSLKADDKNIVFSVANNGESIPQADQSRIFSRMFRASNAQEQDPDGNGLGLYVVKQIVENAGGKVWFTSKKGEDTVFACSFPLSGMIAKSGTKQLA